nr:xylulose kinase-1 [Tanacetum cinerariifolium]
MNIWKVIQNGNSLKRTGRDRDEGVIILPLTTADEHIAVQRESKVRTTLLQSIPDDHVADFHYMDDARDIWNAVKGMFGGNAESKKMRKSMLKQEFLEFIIGEVEGLHKGYDRMQKILSQLNQLKAKPEDADIILKFLRALPSSWSQDAGDAREFALMGVTSEVHNCPFGCDNKYNKLNKQYNELNEQNGEYFIQVQAYKNSLKILEKQKKVLQINQLTLEDKIRVLSIELENTSNLLKHFERINADVETTKKDLQTKLDNHLVQAKKWRNSSKNLFRLIDSSMSVRTKVGLGFNNRIREKELGWDDSAFCVFTTNSEDVEGRPLFHSVSTFENEAEIESNVRTPIQEPIIVQDLPSFSCNSSDKNENTPRTSYNKNGYFNKKAGHFRNNASSVSKLCFVCGSGTHLINDYDFYKKQMANKTVGIGVGLVYCRNKVNHQNQFVPQVVLLRTGKVNIPHARPQPVPTSKPKVFAPVPAGRQNRPFPVPTDRGYSPSVSSSWWKNGQLLLSPQQVVLGNLEKVYTGYPRTIVDLIHLHTNDNVADLLTKAFDEPSASIPSGVFRVPTGSYVNFPTG